MKTVLFMILLAGIQINGADDFCKGKKDGHYQYPPNCNKFYQCSNERTFVMPCPPHTWFFPQNNTCEYPSSINQKLNCTTPVNFTSGVRATAPPPAVPRSECNGNKVGSVPHATECSKFVVCKGNGKGVVKKCASDTNFDPDYRVCVWKSVYSCKGPNFCKGKEDGNYAHPSTCSAFYQCSGGLTYTVDCPENLYYNEKTDKCDYPKNVNCLGKSTNAPTPGTTASTASPTTVPTARPTQKQTTAQVPSATFCNGKKDGNYLHPTRCDLFVSCVAQRVVYVRNCPAGLYYNVETDQCDWPKNVHCPYVPHVHVTTPGATPTTHVPATTPKKTASTPQIPLATFCNGRKDGNYRHPTRCDQFVSCVAQKVVYVRDCPDGLYYNAKIDQCDYPRNVYCPYAPKVTTPGATPTTHLHVTTPKKAASTPQVPSATYCNGKKDGNYVHPTRCDQFVSCVAQKVVYVRDCPAGLYYNARTDQCDWPRNVYCPYAPKATTPSTRSTPQVPFATFCRYKKDGNYLHPTRCDQFVSCVAQRVVYVRNCPAGLYYNARYDQCDWPRNVYCPSSSTPFCIGKKDGNYPDSIRCDRFISCVGGSNYIKYCSNGLYYNPKLDQCDHPKNVRCSTQSIALF